MLKALLFTNTVFSPHLEHLGVGVTSQKGLGVLVKHEQRVSAGAPVVSGRQEPGVQAHSPQRVLCSNPAFCERKCLKRQRF